MIKLVATDIDGTILGKSQIFSPAVVECIDKMQEKGVKVVLVTGRMYASAKQIAKRLNLTSPVVAYQGGMIAKNCDSTELLYNACIPIEDVKKIISWGRKNHAHLNLYSNDILYSEEDNTTIRKYSKIQNVNYQVSSFDDIKLENINKLLAINYDDIDMVTDWVNECQNAMPDLYIVKSTPWFCEFSTKEATKACAVNFLKQYWNLKDDEVLTIGDQDNDIELLKAGGISVAMGNGSIELRQYADYITDTVDNDGFVAAMEQFVLGE